jgi:hypothetical protein
MKNTLMKAASVLTVLGAVIDTHFGLLEELGVNSGVSAWIKVVGIVLTSVLPSVVGNSGNVNRMSNSSKKKGDGAVLPNQGL